MRLVTDWPALLRRAWSVRLLLIAGVLSGIEVSLPLLEGYIDIPPRLFAALSGLSVAAAFVARFIAQKGISDDKQA